MPYTIVIPVLNDERALERLLESLRSSGAQGPHIVVDGGSRDRSVAIAERFGCRVIVAPQGRATQLSAGCELVSTGWVWMLHADCQADVDVVAAIAASTASDEPGWGRFDVRLDDRGAVFRVIEAAMNCRSRLTGICTGDQGIFVHTHLLAAVGGIPDQPLMEDIELSRRLKLRRMPVCLAERLRVSPRRWRDNGIVRTVLLMWTLRLAYFFGASPARLHTIYYGN